MLKRTTEEVEKYFKSHGCELLDEYKGAASKMKYRCSCGQIGNTSWNNFTAGKRCGHCAKNGLAKKRSLEQVKEIYAARGCEFLDDEFKSIHFKHKFRCKCGKESFKSFAAFHHQNQYCKQCGLEKNKKEGHHMWRPDRQSFEQEKKLRKRFYKALQTTLEYTKHHKNSKTCEMLGYTHNELAEHVTSHSDWKMLKDQKWHLDHIFPIKAFIDYGITDPKLINSLDNLRPMLGVENNRKWATYNAKEFEAWIKDRNG